MLAPGPGQRIYHAQGCQRAKFDPFLSLDCARVEGVGGKGSNFAIWQPCLQREDATDEPTTMVRMSLRCVEAAAAATSSRWCRHRNRAHSLTMTMHWQRGSLWQKTAVRSRSGSDIPCLVKSARKKGKNLARGSGKWSRSRRGLLFLG